MKPTERDLMVARWAIGRCEQAFGIEWSVDLADLLESLPEPAASGSESTRRKE